MNKSILASALAAAGLMAAASGSAFAGIVDTGGGDLADSYFRSYTANGGFPVTVLPSFNRFDVTVLGATSFTVDGSTFVITNPQGLEDIAAHDAITNFNVNSGGAGTWVQTSPAGTPGVVSFAAAGGSTITATDQLDFRLNFGPGEMTDGHWVRVDFYQDNAYRTSYSIKFKQGSTASGGGSTFGTEIVNTQIPLPPAVWSGLAMMAGLGVFLAKRRSDRKILS